MRLTAFSPLQDPNFRLVWLCALIANLGMWMSDLAAAWAMTSIPHSAFQVALVQTASSLPVFILGLFTGAMADMANKRHMLLLSQFFVAIVALALCITSMIQALTPTVLLALTLMNGIGLALRWPVMASLIPELVRTAHLPTALTLNSISANLARIFGPVIAGILISQSGPAAVFFLNMLLTMGAGITLLRWNHASVAPVRPRERIFPAVLVGIRYAAYSVPLRRILFLVSIFFFHAAALLALMPVLVRSHGWAAGSFTSMVSMLGFGAICAGLCLPEIRTRTNRRTLVLIGGLLHAGVTAMAARTDQQFLLAGLMFFAGVAWITAANSLSVSGQLVLPHWVRARGMSIFQMAMMGAGAAGAAFWGLIATFTSIHTSLLAAAASSAICLLFANQILGDYPEDSNMSPAEELIVAGTPFPDVQQRIRTSIEFEVADADMAIFEGLLAESRASRLRQGALSWSSRPHISRTGTFVEVIVDASTAAARMRLSRLTVHDLKIQERLLQVHRGPAKPKVTVEVLHPGA